MAVESADNRGRSFPPIESANDAYDAADLFIGAVGACVSPPVPSQETT